MWKARQQKLLAAVSLAVVLVGGGSAGAIARPAALPLDRPGPHADSRTDLELAWDRAGTVAGRDAGSGRPLLGQDGLIYQASPPMVEGGDETVFFGEEFDAACAFGQKFDKGLARIAKLARLIEKSGRRVVFTVAPNKSAVDKAALAAVQLPHGSCDAKGIKQQDHTLDTFEDDNFVPLRSMLAGRAARGVDEYWRVDTHWTSIGATQWAYALAKMLDDRLAARQSYRADTEALEVNLGFLGLIGEIVETARGRATTTKVKVSPKAGVDVSDPNSPSPDIAWKSGPSSRTWPGRTLLLGDSFTYRSIDPLMHLFGHGRFLWVGHTPKDTLLEAVARADTVVIEVVQRYVPGSLLNLKSFRKAVARTILEPPALSPRGPARRDSAMCGTRAPAARLPPAP